MILLETLNSQLCIEEDFHDETLKRMKRIYSPLMIENAILQEGKIGDFFRNIWDHIKALWQKFMAGVDNVFKSNESWFEKYESTLMNTNLRDFEWNMIPYWEGNTALERCKIPSFNPLDKNQLDYCAEAVSYREYIKKTYFQSSKYIDTGDGFTDGLEYLFRGGEAKLMSGTEIASVLRSCISYCKSFNSVHQKVDQYYKNIEKCVKYAQTNAVVRSNGPDDNKNVANTNDENKNESYTFILEDDKTTTDSGVKKVEDQAKKVTELNKELLEKRKKEMSDSVDTTNKDKKDFTDESIKKGSLTKEQADSRVKAYQNYVTVSQQVLSTKLKILKERYDMYMKMFKAILDVGIDQKNIKGNKGNEGVQVKGKHYYEVMADTMILELKKVLSDKKSTAQEKKAAEDFRTKIVSVKKSGAKKSGEWFKEKIMSIDSEIKSTLPDVKIEIKEK